VVKCKICGKEFNPEDGYVLGCHVYDLVNALCRECFHQSAVDRETYAEWVADTRKMAHRDKKDLDYLMNLPYVERIGTLEQRGHRISYPPVEEN
jgi:hypothetical protein